VTPDERGQASRFWPLAELRLALADKAVGTVELRTLTEPDLTPLAAILPADVDLDPAVELVAGVDEGVVRGTALHQIYWRAVGSWRLNDWTLPFGVWADGRLVGMQALEGTDFPRLRTVDSYSWLTTDARGRGIGKAARRAILTLAFGPLAAVTAVTSAWHDNHASLAVSHALGYQPNGTRLQIRGNVAAEMVHLRLDRTRWLTSRRGTAVEIAGFDACRRFFEPPAVT
jgi:RimJ/RimL family protein N-acetyltransferase